MDNNNVEVTKHSKQRCKERLGLSKNNTDKMAEKALLTGIKYTDTTGRLKKYMSYLYESHNREANNIIIYSRQVFIFKDAKLLTIFHLPNQYCQIYDKIQKRLEKGRNK